MIYPEIFNRRNFLLLCGFVSLISLSIAYIAQYYFNINPCILCYYERFFYYGLIMTGALGLLPSIEPMAFKLAGIILFLGTCIALYHLGVELHWWQGTEACHGVSTKAKSIEELRSLLHSKKMARCDQPSWYIFGISATYINLAWFAFFFLAWTVVRRSNKC